MVHQRRLARAVRPEDRDPLAVLDVQVQLVQGAMPVGVAERQRAGVDGAGHVMTPATARSGTRATTTRATKTTSPRARRSGSSAGIRPW